MLQAPSHDYPEREPYISLWVYRLFKWGVVTPSFRGYFRGKLHGLENFPKQGPVIIVSNHASDFDPPMIGAAMRRPVSFMAKAELFKFPLFGKILLAYGAYPVKRGQGDRAAIRAALSQLETGWASGFFIGGTRTVSERIEDPKLGAALIAAKTQVPLLPVSIWGTSKILPKGAKFPRRVPVTIRVGTLIDPPPTSDRADLEAVTAECVAQIHALHDLGR
jgi:1-acyl-sn-glycerol-3-phosphate acyltransferase